MAKQQYYYTLISSNKNDTKKLHQILSDLINLKGKNRSQPFKITTVSGAETHDPVEIADESNSFFSKVRERMVSNILPSSGSLKFRHYTKYSFFLHKISEQVQTLLSKLDEKFLKLSNSVVTPFSTHIFNRCMTEGIYPNYLKEAQIVPLHKSGDSTICSNYRPISLLPQFNKIFEKLLHDILYCFLKDFSLLSEHQYGFRSNSSTALAVEDIYSNLLANHDKGL